MAEKGGQGGYDAGLQLRKQSGGSWRAVAGEKQQLGACQGQTKQR